MSASTWLIIAIVGFSFSGIALVAAIIIFIKMNIPAVIGDLSGKTVAREIKAMRDANASSGDKLHKSSRVNVDRGKLTEKVNDEMDSSVRAAAHASKRLDSTGQSAYLKKDEVKEQHSSSVSMEYTTESLSANVNEVDIEERRSTAVLSLNRETDVLVEERQTEVLSEVHQTEVLNETDGLTKGSDGTAVLSETEDLVQDEVRAVTFKVTKSIIKSHSDEII